MYNVQDCSILYNKVVRLVIYHMGKARAWQHHFTKKGGLET